MLRRLRGPTAQVSAVIALGLMLGFGAAATLTLAKFSDALSNAVEARYAIHAADLRANIETGLNLGLDLEQIGDNVALVVANRLALDEGISAIVVSAADGTEVFAVDRAAAGLEPAPAGAELSRRSLAIENSFGAVVGDVTVVFASGVNEATLRDAAATLLRDLATLVAASVVVASLGCLAAMASLPAAARRAEAILQAEEAPAADHRPVDAADAGGPEPSDGENLEAAAVAAARSSHDALAEIRRIEAALAADPAGRGA